MNQARTKAAPRVRNLLAVLVAAAAAVPAASVATADSTTAASPVGRWATTVSVEGVEHPATLYFTPAGKAFVATGGAGTWSSTAARNNFSYRLNEPMFEENGALFGWLDVSQQGVVKGDTYTSTGSTKVYDSSDRVIRVAKVEIRGTRVTG